MDGLAFTCVMIFVIIYVCCKVCCSDDSDEENQNTGQMTRTRSLPNIQTNGLNYVVTSGPTTNTQSYYNDNHIGFAISPTQSNLPYPPINSGSPYPQPHVERNLTQQFDTPPSYEEAMKQLTQQQHQNPQINLSHSS